MAAMGLQGAVGWMHKGYSQKGRRGSGMSVVKLAIEATSVVSGCP
jgi:hypothetical protein